MLTRDCGTRKPFDLIVPIEIVGSGKHADIVDAGVRGPLTPRWIEGGHSSVGVAYKTALASGRSRVGFRNVPSLVDADPIRDR